MFAAALLMPAPLVTRAALERDMWDELDGWWDSFDADQVGTHLTGDQWDTFCRAVEGTLTFQRAAAIDGQGYGGIRFCQGSRKHRRSRKHATERRRGHGGRAMHTLGFPRRIGGTDDKPAHRPVGKGKMED